MPLYIEYDKITKHIRRFLSADDLPGDAAHLSYVEVPVGTPEIDLSADIDAAKKIIKDHLSSQTTAPSPVEPVVTPPLIEEI